MSKYLGNVDSSQVDVLCLISSRRRRNLGYQTTHVHHTPSRSPSIRSHKGRLNDAMVAHAPLVSILARAALLAKGLIEFLHCRSGLSCWGGNPARILAKLSIQPVDEI